MSETVIDAVYAERNSVVKALVAFASLCGDPVWRVAAPDDPDYSIVYIDLLQGGQVSWHIPNSELGVLEHLPVGLHEWDGHDTETKYKRLEEFTRDNIEWWIEN